MLLSDPKEVDQVLRSSDQVRDKPHLGVGMVPEHVVEDAVRQGQYLVDMRSTDSREWVVSGLESGIQIVVSNEFVSLSSKRFACPIEHLDPRRQVSNLREMLG